MKNSTPEQQLQMDDYINLQNYLEAKKWKEADEETLKVMLKVVHRESEKWLTADSLSYFPCEDLHIIDQLWVKYSNGHFGFSVQKRIYQSLGGTSQRDDKVLDKFGDKVGWRKNNKWLIHRKDFTFSEEAVEAHLPVAAYSWWDMNVPDVGLWLESVVALLSRVDL
ncbi:MAG: GUN4 domain-containing protein [Microcoleus sp.]